MRIKMKQYFINEISKKMILLQNSVVFFFFNISFLSIEMRTISIVILVLALCAWSSVQQGRDDLTCAAVTCPLGFRCEDGKCLRQQKAPKKSLCYSAGPEERAQAVRCTTRDYNCIGAIPLSSCGFTNEGTKKNFLDDCSPCLDQSVDYFFRLPCSDSPAICSETQECVNNACVELFNTAADSNRKICNSDSDCKPIVEICVANKCATKMDLFSQLAKVKRGQP